MHLSLGFIASFCCLIILGWEQIREKNRFSYLLPLLGLHAAIELMASAMPSFNNIGAFIGLVLLETLLSIYLLNRILYREPIQPKWLIGVLGIFFCYFLLRYLIPNEDGGIFFLFLDALMIRGVLVMVFLVYFVIRGLQRLNERFELEDNFILITAFLLFYVGIFYFLLIGRFIYENGQINALYATVYDPLLIIFYAILVGGSLWRILRSS